MNKKLTIISGLVILVLFLGFEVLTKTQKIKGSSTESSPQPVLTQSLEKSDSLTIEQTAEPADKIEVVYFHGTHQCWSCITVGEYALETIKEKFPEEFVSGKIIYKDINGELKENQAIVMKYQARGSSLFVNAIRDDKDDIQENLAVWRLVNNEEEFINYFENKLNTLMGK